MTGTNSFQLKKRKVARFINCYITLSGHFSLDPHCLCIFDFDHSNYFATGKKNLPKKEIFFSGNILPENHALY